MTFWCRRWMLHSRSPRCMTFPWESASTWISMCLGRSMYRSISSRSSPNAAFAIRFADSSAAGSSAASRTSTMPLPPPPAEGLTRTGTMGPFRRTEFVAGSTGTSGTTGTPAAATVAFAAILSPIASIASGGGPMKTRPAAAQARANAAFSARKP
jgi:hypothetical protein